MRHQWIVAIISWVGTYIEAREHRAPAKDPAPSHPAYKHTQTYIQAYTQNKAEAILTNLHTSIYIKQSRHIPTSILTSIPKSIYIKQSRNPSQTAPQKTEQQKIYYLI